MSYRVAATLKDGRQQFSWHSSLEEARRSAKICRSRGIYKSVRVELKETVLYGLPKGKTERYEEVLLLTNGTPEKIERVKVLAARDGFHSFRVAEIDLSKPPDFLGTIRRKGQR